jgi:5-methylcytosine-specific restriction endonuclease McrA
MRVQCYSTTIRDLCWAYTRGKIVLDPPYQRRPAWKPRQRWELLGSVFNGIPIPAVILYRTKGSKGATKLEVMDGKQRLETIFHFRYGKVIRGEGRLGFWLRRDDSKKREWFYFADLRDRARKEQFGLTVSKFLDYKLPVIEYSGELVGLAGQRIAEKEIFAKINSTGSKLTKNEIRHAQSTEFFEMGSRLETRWKNRMVEKWKVFSKSEVSRYQYHEFMLELATVVLNQGISDKRKLLDKYMRTDFAVSELKKTERQVNQVMDWICQVVRDENFPSTRFHKKADFYTLFALFADLRLKKHAVTVDRKLNKRAREALIRFSRQANKVDAQVKRYLPARLSAEERRYAKYIIATREGTDQIRNRENRDAVLRLLLEPIFAKRKSSRRAFDLGVKQELWYKCNPRSGKIRCPNPNDNPRCQHRMTFEECEVDHRKAHVRGGPTHRSNAQLLCRSCNRQKGAR